MKQLWWIGVAIGLLLAGGRVQAAGSTHTVRPEDGPDGLTTALARAADGDMIEVIGGVYGPIDINKPVILVGKKWPVLDGAGKGSVVTINAPDVTISGFVVRGSGDSLDQENAGIVVIAPRATISGNHLQETLFGIYLRHADGSLIENNEVGSLALVLPRRGDGIRVWYSNDVTIAGNNIDKGRDVVLWYSERLTVSHNTVTNGRYGLHFMYCDDALIEGNRLLHNSVGAFLMYSRRMHLLRNTIAFNRGPSGYGVGLKDMDDALVVDNLFLDNRIGAHLDNSPREIDSIGQFRGNVFGYNDIGVNLLPAVQRNQFSDNSFVENQEQVGVAGGGQLQGNWWTVAGVGNYWSDYAGYDAGADGQGDIPYRSERLFENLLDNNPALRLFLFSPAANAVDFAAVAFPFVKPQPKLTDDQPLMRPHLPPNVPALPGNPSAAASWLALALALAGTALGILWLPRLRPPHTRPTALAPLPGDSTMTTVTVTKLSKRFGGLTAVDDLSFTATAGQAVALWGANGAGKTTVLRCLLHLMPFEGEITLGGLDVTRHGKAARRLVGFVPQELTFHDDLSVDETLYLYARLKKVDDSAIRPLLEQLQLEPHLQKQVRDLSGGLKQRLALALALLADPPILILDEPTASLDIRARDDFLALLLTLKHAGKTLIFSSHRLEEVTGLADRVLVLEAGKLVADSSPDLVGQRLGREATLHLYLPAERLEPALAVLTANGLAVSRNGRGLQVQVAPGHKGMPLQILHNAGIPVADFVIE